MNTETQQITVGFRTAEELARAKQMLSSQGISDFQVAEPAILGDRVPQQRRPDSQSGLPKAAALGGITGALMGAVISTFALNVPNLPSIEGSTTEMYVLVPLGGALLGAIASSLLSLLSGANPTDEDIAYFRLSTQLATAEDTQSITDALLKAGGRLL